MFIAPVLFLPLLVGCAALDLAPSGTAGDGAPQPPEMQPVPTSVTAPPPRPTARTVEEFDTTTTADRAAALAAAATAGTGETRLGTTIASLGSPADPGIWMSTPLVSETVMGRVEVAQTGKSVVLELRPSGGAPGSGSQISLPALRLLEIALTALPELVVYR